MADSTSPSAYELLGVHPSAPNDLVSAAYWMAVADLQRERGAGAAVDATLHALTRSYELLADPQKRAQYNASSGFGDLHPPGPRGSKPFLVRLLRRRPPMPRFDCYEVIGLDPAVPGDRIPEAFRIMRNHYLGVRDIRRQQRLLFSLSEAYTILSDECLRTQYNQATGFPEPDTTRVKADLSPSELKLTTEKPADASRPPPIVLQPETQMSADTATRPVKQRRPAQRLDSAVPEPLESPPGGQSKLPPRIEWAMSQPIESWKAFKRMLGTRTRGGATKNRTASAEATPPRATPAGVSADEPKHPAEGRRVKDAEAQFLGRLASRVNQEEPLRDEDTDD